MAAGEANIWNPRTLLQLSADTKRIEEKFTATAGQSLFTLSDFAYVISVGSLAVYKNGLLLKEGVEWTENTATTFSLTVGAVVGDVIIAVGFVGMTANVDVRDTDIFVPDYQAIRDYAGTEVSLYAQGHTTLGDGGEHFFEKHTGAAPAFFVDNNYNIIVPAGGDGSIAWLCSTKPFVSIANAVKFSLRQGVAASTISYYSGWEANRKGPVGGESYIVVTKAEHDLVRSPRTVVDELGDHTLPNGNVLLMSINGPINAAAFGLILDGTAATQTHMQAAIDTANLDSTTSVDLYINTVSSPIVFTPSGKCLLTATVNVPGNIRIEGENTIWIEPTQLINMFDVVGFKNEFNNSGFDGGLNQVRVVGPNTDYMTFDMDGCEYRNPGNVSILHDATVNHGPASGTPRDSFSLLQTVSNFRSYNDALIIASADRTTLTNGWTTFRPYLGPSARTGDQVWATCLIGPLTVEGILAVSVSGDVLPGTALSFWFELGLIGGTNGDEEAWLTVNESRFGEAGSALAKATNCREISISDSATFFRPGNQFAWIECYNQIPSITASRCEGWTDSLGILIDSGTIPDLDAELLQRRSDLFFEFKDLKDTDRASTFVHTTRATYKANGLSQPQVTERLLPWRLNKGIELLGAVSSTNLFTLDVFDSSSGAFVNTSVANVTQNTGTDTTTGRTLNEHTATATGAQFGKHIAAWGLTEAAVGLHTFSVVVKTTESFPMDLRYGNLPINTVTIPETPDYVRIYGVFWHDGTDKTLGFQALSIPNGAVFSVGLFQVNPGQYPTDFTMPLNVSSGHVAEHYYGTAAPVVGNYKLGDILWHTAPAAAGKVGFVCTTAGSPGTWKAFGAIDA